ncbi:MAG TPA: flippase [Patescibacteria group bacterium]|nr:flippase [Patescibacteria group bacterium]
MSKGENLVKNTTFFTGALAIQKILSFVYFIFVARIIGVENTGRLSFVMSFVTMFGIFLDFGMAQIIIRESARDRNTSQKYLANAIGLKVLGSIIIYGAVVLIINLMGYPTLTIKMVYVAGIVMLLESFTLVFYAVLRGHHNLRYESIGVIINQVIILVVGFTVLFLDLGLIALVGVYLFGSLFNFFYAAILLKAKLNIIPRISFNRQVIKEILKLSLPFAMAGIFVRIFASMDIVLLSKLGTNEAVGLYSVAYKIVFAFQFIALAFLAGIYPVFCTYYIKSKDKLATTFTASLKYLIILSIPISFGLIALADSVIGPVFGMEYKGSVLPLQIMMTALILIFINYPYGAMLNACNRQTRNTIHLAIVAIFNLIANIILIPIWSYVGVAIAFVASYILMFGLNLIAVNKILAYDKRGLVWSLIKIVFSGVAMVTVILLLKNKIHFIFVTIIAGLVYVTLVYLLKEFTKTDILQIKEMLIKKGDLI